MIKSYLLAAIIFNCLAATTALRYCSLSYLTTDPAGGTADLAQPRTCTTTTVKTRCTGGFNAQCLFSLRSYSYVCCFQILTPTLSTPDPDLNAGSTFETLNPGNVGVTANPRNLKPICPANTIGYGSNSVALACNITNLANAGCPVNYKCTKAANVYDFYATPTNTGDDVGAAATPYCCCKTPTTSVFADALLTPSPVPTAPTSTIVTLNLPSATTPALKARKVYIGDDYSTLDSQLTDFAKAATTSITFYTKTIAAPSPATADAPGRYHVLFFDAQTNKDAFFVGNIPGTAAYDLPIGPAVVPSAKTHFGAAQVYYDSTAAAYKLNAAPGTYKLAPYTTGHKYALLVFQTTTLLDFGAATGVTAADTTKILLGSGPFGDFDPAGKFTTVTAFLNGKGKLLGTPIAGGYFTFKN